MFFYSGGPQSSSLVQSVPTYSSLSSAYQIHKFYGCVWQWRTLVKICGGGLTFSSKLEQKRTKCIVSQLGIHYDNWSECTIREERNTPGT